MRVKLKGEEEEGEARVLGLVKQKSSAWAAASVIFQTRFIVFFLWC